MSGAYVAKPAVDLPPPEGPPTVDDVPPGWDLDWPFPGTASTDWPGGLDPDPFFPAPHPPGYEPDYSLVMTADAEIGYSGTVAVTGSLRDHSTFVTNEPTPVIWTATVASSPSRSINLRFSGDGEYASSISSDCALETYWGVTPDIEFELEEDDGGGTVTLTGTSSVGGVAVEESIEIEVYELSLDMSAAEELSYSGTLAVEVDLKDSESKTEEPVGSTLIWTATVDGVAVGLRFSGDEEYSSSIESVYSDLTDFWGAEEDIEFDLTADNEGDTLVLQVASTAFGVDLIDEVEVVITAEVFSLLFSISMTDLGTYNPALSAWLIRAIIDNEPPDSQYGMSEIDWDTGNGYEIDETERGGVVCTQDISTKKITISIDELEPGTFTVWYHVGAWRHSIISNLFINVSGAIYTKQIVQDANPGPEDEQLTWLTIDGATGEVTIINP